ncbi:MAG: PKD domain-containing protein, partial [Candidatus Thermoplasmatota archaeon]|nr:PKD domain-containing protein [Candidatus Thermoplasmatota archaeon]
GPDMIVGAGTNVTLNANGTWDHSQILSYVWIFTYDGVGRTLSGMDVDFRFDLIGTYPVLLIVRDIWENAATDTLIVEVKDLSPPLIEAGNDMNLTAGEPAFLNGSAWDNVGITEYTWRFKYNESEVVLEGNTVLFEFKIPGNYIVSLFVQDEAGNIANDTITVNVAKSSVIDINDTVDDDDPDDDDLDDDSDDNDDIDDDNGDGIPQDTDEEKGSGILWFWILAILVMLMFITMCLFVVIMKHRSREKSVPPITSNNDEMNPKQMKLDLPEDETTDKLSSDEGEKIVPVSKKIDTLPTEEF